MDFAVKNIFENIALKLGTYQGKLVKVSPISILTVNFIVRIGYNRELNKTPDVERFHGDIEKDINSIFTSKKHPVL